jgi:ABC-type transporter Mla MlaB component
MLQIAAEQHGDRFSLSLEGMLTGESVPRLTRLWNSIRQTIPLAVIVVNLSSVTFIDPAGRRLLEEMSNGGIAITTSSDGARDRLQTAHQQPAIKGAQGAHVEADRHPLSGGHARRGWGRP